jgi:hypothetical protein
MKSAVVILIPTALFAFAIWAIVRGIEPMVAQENNNKAIARIMGCAYIGRLEGTQDIVIHECDDKIELVKEIKW